MQTTNTESPASSPLKEYINNSNQLAVDTSLRKKMYSNVKTPSKSPTSALGFAGHLLLRKQGSIAFFVNLTSPQDHKPFPVIRKASMRASPIRTKMARVNAQRNRILQERREKLRLYVESIKGKVMLQKSRDRLKSLKLQAKLEYKMSSANLRRQMKIQDTIARLGSIVDHAQNVMLMKKLRRFLDMRRALSETFVDFFTDETIDVPNSAQESLPPLMHEEDESYSPETPQVSSPPKKSFDPFGLDERPREPIAKTIQRTKSLPCNLLDDTDDFTFLELLNLLPPITRFTLRELELDEILSNVQLRHDLVFDPDLQFKPNTDGDDKKERADAYWSEVQEEISQNYYYRIPLLLAEIRAILVELIPDGKDKREDIETHIDVHLISQELEHGVFSPVKLIEYIARVMKTNCAPIRDELVDKMVKLCHSGEITESFRLCFDILEYMKLDYANHQLTKLRPYVIEHGSSFEWKWFQSQMETKNLSLEKTKNWVRESKLSNQTNDYIISGIFQLISKSNSYQFDLPETFKMDGNRIVNYYNEWQDMTILASILVIYKQAAGPKSTLEDIESVKKQVWILLNDHETTMAHVHLQLAHLAGKTRGKPLDQKEEEAFGNLIDKTLAPESKLYELIQKRIGEHLMHIVQHKQLDMDLLTKHGFLYLKTELMETGTKIATLVQLNKAVYGQLYTLLLEEE